MHNEKVKKTVEELLTIMGVTFESVTPTSTEERTAFVIKTPEARLLIGAHGAHITALNHLVRRMMSKGVSQEDIVDFYVDVNDYRETLLQDMKQKAQILAGRARSFKTNVEMDPMSSYERMIIHTFFQDSPDIRTESVGTGVKRHVVLKYVGE